MCAYSWPYNVTANDRALHICAFRNRSSSVVKLYLSEEIQALDQYDSEIFTKNGWLNVAGGAINMVSKSQILLLFHFMTIVVYPYELKTNLP